MGMVSGVGVYRGLLRSRRIGIPRNDRRSKYL